MSIQEEISGALRGAGVTAFQQRAPQGTPPPFTAFRQLDSTPEATLDGSSSLRNSIFVFFNVAKTPAGAVAQRDQVNAAILGSATLKERYAFQVSSGEAEYEENTDQPIEPSAFSFWHE